MPRLLGKSRRRPLRRQPFWGWIRLLRPNVLFLGTGTVIGFAFIFTGGHPEWHEIFRVAIAMAAGIGFFSVMNDVLDLDRDRDVYIWRPLPSGLVDPTKARILVLILAFVTLGVCVSLSWRSLLIAIGLLAVSWLYNSRLKTTPLSWIAFPIIFSLIPFWVSESLHQFATVLWWSVPVGFTAGLVAHMVIKLPDYERNDVNGSRNVLHWLTIDYAVPVTWGLMGAYIVIAVASANVQGVRIEWIGPPAFVAILLTLTVICSSFFGVTERKLIIQRWLLSVAVIGVSIGWLGSIMG